ncbi:P-loop containing nucleoside triphosphate hydrolase protein [Imleria badia]|nr:P-loop containing nucleoside triphosphate hydrolase protein [Imleria badia]
MVVKCIDDAVTMRHIQPLLDATDRVLGVSATYGKQCQLSSIAFATLSRVLVVTIPARHVPQPKDAGKRRRVAKSRGLIEDHLLLNPKFQKYAFKMDQFAVSLYLDLSVRINDTVDMLSVGNAGRQSLQALMTAMGGETHLQRNNVQSLFFNTSKSSTIDAATNVALEAWGACRAATLPHMSSRFMSLPRIETKAFPKAHLDAVASICRHAERLDALKPSTAKNDVADRFTMKKGVINLVCGRFSTRIKHSTSQVIQIEIEGKEATSQVMGRTRKVNGRSARINVNGPVQGEKILSVTTIGKDNPTFSESTRRGIILETLQQKTTILLNPFFQTLWLPKERPVWPKSKGQRGALSVHSSRDLNASQHAAVRRILSDKDNDRLVMIQGPPGTGKTTVIAASVISHDHANSGQSIWVAAQSNVAVKNIAEKFIKDGFHGFRLLVSWDFHYEWHEHLYEENLEPLLIRSDSFKESIVDASTQLLGCKVILCTLSMFSNPKIGAYVQVVPVEMIILDEASQIECGDYIPIFHLFHSTLSKIVFIGDDKQLPPYGQEDIPELRSVFEISHLRRRALFLDTQYRMPHVIGDFISRNVYAGKLLTCHDPETSKPCRFIDVNKGRETKKGHSWVNEEEARVVAKLVELYKSRAMSFRIITPYDAQRSLIENLLKREKLPWEDKVFNVDSFQGSFPRTCVVDRS